MPNQHIVTVLSAISVIRSARAQLFFQGIAGLDLGTGRRTGIRILGSRGIMVNEANYARLGIAWMCERRLLREARVIYRHVWFEFCLLRGNWLL